MKDLFIKLVTETFDFLKDEFDKILLVSILILLGTIYVHLLHHGPTDTAAIGWVEKTFDTLTGALLILVTGGLKKALNGLKQ